ncbi:hypothetical protein M1N59_02025 [Dehalococcoidales bacterium]|nr:hypothetical protein [Dehalococcoidales bacterium]
MAATRKLGKRVVLFVGIEEAQHEALRFIAYKEKRSIADVAREAIEEYVNKKSGRYPTTPFN